MTFTAILTIVAFVILALIFAGIYYLQAVKTWVWLVPRFISTDKSTTSREHLLVACWTLVALLIAIPRTLATPCVFVFLIIYDRYEDIWASLKDWQQ